MKDLEHLGNWDIIVLALYFVLILGTSIFSVYGQKRNTVDSYFLAGRQMTWVFVGASLFASNIGSEHFIGLAGSGAASGISVGAFELNAMIVIQFLGWVFLPVFIASGVATLPEYMNKRFGGNRIRVYLTCLSLVLYIFTKISVNLYSGALFIEMALGWNLWYSVLFILALTGVCTIAGGLTAVIYTETLQTSIMIIGSLILMVFSFKEIGGYESLYIKYMESVPSNFQKMIESNTTETMKYLQCGLPKENSFQMLRSLGDKDMPWLGFLLGKTPSSIWYWCSDQMMVQRTLAAKSLSHAQGGTLFAGYLKVLPLFMMVMPGMISRVLFPDIIGCIGAEECFKACGNRNGCSNSAYPLLIMKLMPTGFKGLMISCMLAALMSDLTSIFNSASTLFTCDIYKQIRKKASNKELMISGRLFVIFMVVIGIVWIPIIKDMQGAQLYIYIQSVSAYLSPPIAATYILAILWKKTNEKGAFWGLMAGLITGVSRMILDFIYIEPACGEEDKRPMILKDVHYLNFAILLFVVTFFVTIVISLTTKKIEDFRLIRTTYSTRKDNSNRPDETESETLKDISDNSDLKLIKSPKNQLKIELQPELQVKFVNISRSKKIYRSFISIFCGYDVKQSEDNIQLQNSKEKQRRIESFESLNQTKFERFILNINLCIILTVAVALYVFFSIPPEWHIFSHIKLNRTRNA